VLVLVLVLVLPLNADTVSCSLNATLRGDQPEGQVSNVPAYNRVQVHEDPCSCCSLNSLSKSLLFILK